MSAHYAKKEKEERKRKNLVLINSVLLNLLCVWVNGDILNFCQGDLVIQLKTEDIIFTHVMYRCQNHSLIDVPCLFSNTHTHTHTHAHIHARTHAHTRTCTTGNYNRNLPAALSRSSFEPASAHHLFLLNYVSPALPPRPFTNDYCSFRSVNRQSGIKAEDGSTNHRIKV